MTPALRLPTTCLGAGSPLSAWRGLLLNSSTLASSSRHPDDLAMPTLLHARLGS